MIDRVEEPDDFTVDAEGPRDPDVLAEGPRHPLGDTRLAVARRAVEKESSTGMDGWTESSQHRRGDQQVVEGAPQIVDGRLLTFERLCLHALDVVGDRNRGRSEVGAVLRQTPGTLATEIGQLVAVVVHRRRAAIDDLLLMFQFAEEGFEHHEGEGQLFGDVATGDRSSRKECLEDERFDFCVGEAGFGDRSWRGGEETVDRAVRFVR